MQSLWMLFAAFMFSIMGVCVKMASDQYSTSEIVMYRGLVGVVFIYLLARCQGVSLRTAYPWHHLWRGAVGATALWLWFYAMGELPLATAVTLNSMAPIWIAAILFLTGWWRGQGRFEAGLSAAILLSFIGVALLLRPSFRADQWFAGMVGLGSGFLSSLAYLQVRKLGQLGEPESRVVFYFSMIGIVVGVIGIAAGDASPGNPGFRWNAHTGGGLVLLLGAGLTAAIAQMALTRAYRLGRTLLTANLQYTGIVFSSLWGFVFWGDLFGIPGWVGIGLILASGIATTYFNARKPVIAAPAAAADAIVTAK